MNKNKVFIFWYLKYVDGFGEDIFVFYLVVVTLFGLGRYNIVIIVFVFFCSFLDSEIECVRMFFSKNKVFILGSLFVFFFVF